VIAEANTLHDLSVANVEAGNYALGKWFIPRTIRCSSGARPPPPRCTVARARKIARVYTPPDACQVIFGKRRTALSSNLAP
jgi:hypothetical protein